MYVREPKQKQKWRSSLSQWKIHFIHKRGDQNDHVIFFFPLLCCCHLRCQPKTVRPPWLWQQVLVMINRKSKNAALNGHLSLFLRIPKYQNEKSWHSTADGDILMFQHKFIRRHCTTRAVDSKTGTDSDAHTKEHGNEKRNEKKKNLSSFAMKTSPVNKHDVMRRRCW